MLLLSSKIGLCLIVGVPNLLLAYKIIIRPHIHTIFNTSLAVLFCVSGIFGPLSYSWLLDIVKSVINDEDETLMGLCARYQEFNHLLGESLKIITANIMFRFFYIVYANRGLVLNGIHDSRLFKICFTISTLALTISNYLSFRIDKVRDELYPQNTIAGKYTVITLIESIMLKLHAF